jgi:hypothetical protein
MTAPPIRRMWQRLTDAIGGIGAMVVLVPTLLALLVYVVLFVRSVIRQPTLPHLIALLFLWQTQTGAAFALAAALIGAIAILRQTGATKRREEGRRERRANALRAMLPLMLSELIDYAAHCADILAEVIELKPAPWRWPIDQQIPPLPSGFVGQLTDLIEAIPLDYARPLVTLVKRAQIQHSRALDLQQRILSPRQGEIVVRANLLLCLIDATEVRARCERLFPYARGEMSAPPAAVSADDVQRAAFLAVRASLLDEVAAEIDRYAASKAVSWPDEPV